MGTRRLVRLVFRFLQMHRYAGYDECGDERTTRSDRVMDNRISNPRWKAQLPAGAGMVEAAAGQVCLVDGWLVMVS